MPDRRNMLRDNDIRLATIARELTVDEWAQPSLCHGWTNHDVLAHLVDGYRLGPSTVLAGLARHRGSFDRANADLARRRATQLDPQALLADLAQLSSRPRGLGRVFPPRLLLGDHVIHELDIVLPLGRTPSIPVGTLINVLDTQVKVPNPFVAAAAHAADYGWSPPMRAGRTDPGRRSRARLQSWRRCWPAADGASRYSPATASQCWLSASTGVSSRGARRPTCCHLPDLSMFTASRSGQLIPR